MTDLLYKAREILDNEGYTCVITDGEHTYTSKRRGVAPLLDLIDKKTHLSGFCAADKVVGAGAAYLYVLMGISALWAAVLSENAKSILTQHGIDFYCGECVPFIINRTRDGVCPMESAVKDATSPEDALAKMKEALSKMK